MKRLIIFPLLTLCGAAASDAEIYTWTDDQGVVTFTDNPSRIPSRFSSRTQSGDIITIHTPTKSRRPPGKKGKKQLHAIIPGNRSKSIAAAKARQKQLPLDMQSEVKGHLGGDQTDPTPPSMKQPKPMPSGMKQPKPMSPGMKQPIPAPLGDQPKRTPAGMKQPKPQPTGDQPPPTSSGMEQPDSKR